MPLLTVRWFHAGVDSEDETSAWSVWKIAAASGAVFLFLVLISVTHTAGENGGGISPVPLDGDTPGAMKAFSTAFGGDRICYTTGVADYFVCQSRGSCEATGPDLIDIVFWACYLPLDQQKQPRRPWACLRDDGPDIEDTVVARRFGGGFDHRPCRGAFHRFMAADT